jgi:lysophospholipase L1-like esterase
MPPIKPSVQEIVKIIARSYKDTILEIPELSKDKVHPTSSGYKKLAEMTK